MNELICVEIFDLQSSQIGFELFDFLILLGHRHMLVFQSFPHLIEGLLRQVAVQCQSVYFFTWFLDEYPAKPSAFNFISSPLESASSTEKDAAR